MYDKYFGLSGKPFSIAPDPRYLFMSDQHREALAHLLYGVGEGGGFVLLTGEVGTGKTTVCRCLLEQLPENTHLAFILNPKLSATELLSAVCDELGIEHDERPTLKQLNDALNNYLLDAHAKGEQTVLMIDEAQNLDTEVLEQIRLLTNLETNDKKLLQIILIGQPELKDLLAKHELRQLAQRITARYHLHSLSPEECRSYISHRLGVSGYTSTLFDDKAIDELYRRTGGIPRLINVLCDRAMLGAYAKNSRTVDVRMIKQAAMEIMGGEQAPAQADVIKMANRGSGWMWSTAIVSLLLVVATSFAYPRWQQLNQSVTELSVSLSTAESEISALKQDKQRLQQTVADLEEEKRIRDQQLLPFLPADLKPINKNQALTELSRHWDIEYQPAIDGELCEYVRRFDKQCAEEVGDWVSLNRLDRPAILHLMGKQGQTVYGVIEQLTQNQVIMNFEGKSFRLSRDQLSAVWNGTYSYLWNTPPGYSQPLRLQMRGQAVQWLKTNLARLDDLDLIVPPDTAYDQDLQFQVLKFQEKYGLKADAIAGPSTIITLNSLIGEGHPTLAWEDS